MSTLGIDASSLNLRTVDSIGLLSTSSRASSTQDTTKGGLNINGDAATTDISKPAQLASKLNQLKTQDPAKYKQVVTEIAKQLTDAASQATGDDKQFLTSLAGKFQDAANGKDLDLTPPQAANPGKGAAAAYAQGGAQTQKTSGKGGHHHHAHSASTQQTLESVFNEVNAATGGTTSATGTASIVSPTNTAKSE